MANIKQIKQEIESTNTIMDLTQAMGDIATNKLRKSRKVLEHNVFFFQEITKVYRQVRRLALKSNKPNLLIRKTNGKMVCILLTSSSRFNGGLDAELAKFFATNTVKLNSDRIVVGFLGKDILSSLFYPHNFEFIQFKEDSPSFSEMSALTKKVFNYTKILVFHTKFVTLLNQIPAISDISESSVDQRPDLEKEMYILEPEIEKMIVFFETQIASLLFQAIFAEVDIARTAARMISMNQAEQNAKKVIDKEIKILRRFNRSRVNEKTIETYGSLLSNKIVNN